MIMLRVTGLTDGVCVLCCVYFPGRGGCEFHRFNSKRNDTTVSAANIKLLNFQDLPCTRSPRKTINITQFRELDVTHNLTGVVLKVNRKLVNVCLVFLFVTEWFRGVLKSLTRRTSPFLITFDVFAAV
jgi:hypothetical protein